MSEGIESRKEKKRFGVYFRRLSPFFDLIWPRYWDIIESIAGLTHFLFLQTELPIVWLKSQIREISQGIISAWELTSWCYILPKNMVSGNIFFFLQLTTIDLQNNHDAHVYYNYNHCATHILLK